MLTNTESRERVSGAGSLVLFLGGVVSVYSVFGLMVKGTIPQLEMFFAGGMVPFHTYYLTLLLFSFVMVMLTQGNLRGGPQYLFTLFLAVYYVLEFVFLSITTDHSASGNLQSFYGYLAPLFVLSLASAIQPLVREKTAMRTLWLLFAACLAVSTIQFTTKTTFLPTRSADGVFVVDTFDFYGRVRAFSLFTSALEAGVFYCFIGAIATNMLWSRSYPRKIVAVVIIGASAFGCYSSLTRLAILGYIACVISATLIRMSTVRWLPVIWLALAIVIVVQAAGHTGIGRADIGSTSSVDTRFLNWGYYWQHYRSSAPLQIFLGSGTSSYCPPDTTDRPENSALMPIDNGFLEVLLHGGIVGLALVVFFYLKIWRLIRNKVAESPTDLNVGVLSLLAAAPFFMAINDIQEQIVMAAVLCLVTKDATAANHACEPFDALTIHGQVDVMPVMVSEVELNS